MVLAGVPGVALSLQEHTPFIDCDVTFKSCCKHARGGFGNLVCIKITVCVSVSHIGAHTIHPIAMKLSQVVVNMPVVVLEI